MTKKVDDQVENINIKAFEKIEVNRFKKPLLLGIGIVFGLVILFSSYFTVDAGEKGVIRRFGETIRTVDAGLGFKLPIVDSLIKISTREQTLKFESLAAYTRDQQSVNADLAITFNVVDPIDLYNRYRTIPDMVNQIISPRVRAQLETTFGQFTVETSIKERAKLSETLQNNVRKAMEGQPIQLGSLQLAEIKYSDAYERGIEQSMQKNIEIQTQQRQHEIAIINAKIRTTEAQAVADAQIIKAKADAEQVRLQGEAEAAAIRAKGEALKENQQLVQLTAAERWNGVLPQTMLPNSSVPFIQMPKSKE